MSGDAEKLLVESHDKRVSALPGNSSCFVCRYAGVDKYVKAPT